MVISYYRYHWGTRANTPTGPMTLASGFSLRTFLFCGAYALLFGLAYRTWPALRRATATAAGMTGVAVAYGIALGALIHFVIFPSKIAEMPYEALFWLRYVLFVTPPIVWAVRRFSPLATPRPLFARRPPEPTSGGRLIAIGIVVAIPALLVLYWLTTPAAGALMILALFVGLGAIAILVIATAIVLGGLWTIFGWPGRLLASLSPILIAAGAVWWYYTR
jgi:hypothetical protein